MANKKMTKKDYFAILKANYPKDKADYAEVMKFIDHEVELLEKKNSADKKPTAQQLANASTKDSILDCMADGKSYTITDLIKVVPACADMTNQRVSALVRQLVADGSVIRIEDKRKAYFKKA